VFFAKNVLWPNGSDLDYIATLIGVAAFVALFRFKIGIMSVIAACASIGLALTLLT
jgi:chromate transporter